LHRHGGFIASLALVVGLAWPALASADPIQITSGSMVWTGSLDSARITAIGASGALEIDAVGRAAGGLSTPVQNPTVPPVENPTDRRGDEPQIVAAS